MENTGKNNLHMVQANWEEIEQKVRAHRAKQLKIAALIIGICVALGIIYYVWVQHKEYTDYEIVEQVERSDTAATRFLEYNGNILKYSNDGASYINVQNEAIWNQTYELLNPMVSICGEYVILSDKEGKEIYVLNSTGYQSKIKVNMPILRVEVASQGTVAVLMEEEGVSYLALYDKSGVQLAEGGIYIENSGAPIDIALSADGKKMGVAVLDVKDGKVKTTVQFYDFGAVGQNKVDNIVASYVYEDCVIPEITYVSADQMLAFGDNAVYSYSGTDIPKEIAKVGISEEVQSVFCDDTYFGLVFPDGTGKNGRNIKIYDLECSPILTIHTDLSYNTIRFLDNHEICLYSDSECAIYSLGGLEKFRYKFEENIRGIQHANGYRGYIFITESATEQVRLKLLGKTEEKADKK